MYSIRPFRRFASWLALAALVLQIVVSFGHLHLDGVSVSHRPDGVIGFKAQAKPLPAPQPSDDEDGYCAICATIYLAANSFIPQAPALPALFVSKTTEHFPCVAISSVAMRWLPFQSRGPPLG